MRQDESSGDYQKRSVKVKKLAIKSGIIVVVLAISLFLIGGVVSYGQETESITFTVRTVATPPMENWRG
ncbi:hypothetical protein KAS10_03365, partial [Candidatus Aerophobetes bacterium]|nr:hypothetical protein [Candidatus Aerophobetes bacterium]